MSDWLFFALAYTFFPKKRFYLWTHGWYGKEGGLDAKMKLWLYRHASGTFVYGDRAKRLLIEQGISEEKLFAIHNSLMENIYSIRQSYVNISLVLIILQIL